MRNPFLSILVVVLSGLIYIPSCKEATSAENLEVITSPTDTAGDSSIHVRLSTPATPSQKKGKTICPVCKRKKNADQERCDDCNDELANTCYRCDRYEYQLNGKLCSECSKKICAICNRRKDSKDDDLCAKCHNAIELKRQKTRGK